MFIGSEERGGKKERELLLGAQIVDHQLCSVNRPDASDSLLELHVYSAERFNCASFYLSSVHGFGWFASPKPTQALARKREQRGEV